MITKGGYRLAPFFINVDNPSKLTSQPSCSPTADNNCYKKLTSKEYHIRNTQKTTLPQHQCVLVYRHRVQISQQYTKPSLMIQPPTKCYENQPAKQYHIRNTQKPPPLCCMASGWLQFIFFNLKLRFGDWAISLSPTTIWLPTSQPPKSG